METDKEAAIRQRAYEIWEKSGRPHGRDEEHWHKAVHEVTNGNGAVAPAKTKIAKKPVRTAAAAAPPSPVRRKK